MKKITTILLLCFVAVVTHAMPQMHVGELSNTLRIPREQRHDKHTAAVQQSRLQRLITITTQDTITLNFAGFSKFGFDTKYNDWYMEIVGTDASKPEYGYRVIMAFYATSDNYCGTYTSANNQINMADSYVYNPQKGYVECEEVTLTLDHKQVSVNLEQIIANITILGKDGCVYQVTCVHNTITPKNKVEALLDCATLNKGEDSFTMAAVCANYDVSLTINSASLLGNFSMNAIDLQNSHFKYAGNDLEILSIQAAVAAQQVQSDLACVAQVAFLTTDTVQYVLTMLHVLPAALDTVEVICTNLDVDGSLAEYIGVVNFEATNDDYIVSGTWGATEASEGVYTEVAIDLLDMPNGVEVNSLYTVLNVALEENGTWTINGNMRGDNNVVYNLNLSYVVPEPTDTVVVRFAHSAEATFHPEFDNDLLLDNTDDDFYASVNIKGVGMGDVFTMLNVDKEYCGVQDLKKGKKTELADITGRIFQVADTTIIRAELISMDAILYDIELWYVAPTPIDTVTLSFPVAFGDLRSEQGFYQLYGPSPDTSYVVAFSPLSEDIEGTFVNDGMFGKFGAEGGRYEMAASYTYIAIIKNDMLLDLMAVEKGQMTVEMDDDGNINAVAEVICTDHVLYQITMTSKYVKEYLRGDTPSGSVERTYTKTDKLLVEDYSSSGYLYVAVLANDMSDMVAMHIFVETTDPDIVVPEGTYPINKSYRPNTVLANIGLNDKNELQTPFYATIDAQGYLQNVYMWVKGEVLVEKNENNSLRFEVNALNSYDLPVHVVYDESITGVENLNVENAAFSKQIIDGQLRIIHGENVYNAIGTRIQ